MGCKSTAFVTTLRKTGLVFCEIVLLTVSGTRLFGYICIAKRLKTCYKYKMMFSFFPKNAALVSICFAATCFFSCSKGTDDSSQFVTLTDAVPDAILEIRYFGTYNFVGKRIDGYEEPTALLTKAAADSLRAVSDDVKAQGYRLKIFDAYRPQRAVDHFMHWGADLQDTLMKTYFYADLDKTVLFPQGYICERSGHTRGSTVDLTLFDMTTEKELDMGGTFDWFGPESHPDFCGNPDTGEYNAEAAQAEKRGITE